MTTDFATGLSIDYGHVKLLPVHFDDLDPMGMVHNARYGLLIERALTTFWNDRGHTFHEGRPNTPDAFNVVKELSISYHAPIRGTGDVLVHFWLEHIGRSSAVYGFRLLSPSGTTVHAEGRRVVIKLDQTTLRPSPWSPETRSVAEGLLHRARAHTTPAAEIRVRGPERGAEGSRWATCQEAAALDMTGLTESVSVAGRFDSERGQGCASAPRSS